jgi:hypothetical protein
MQVGVNSPRLFACPGALTDDGKSSTTALYEVTPRGTAGQPATVTFIQDLLNGDSRFTVRPSKGEPLSPGYVDQAPVPSMTGPAGNEVTQGIVRCAMTQTGDDTSSLKLHLFAIQGSWLLHATVTSWGSVTQHQSQGSPVAFSRLRVVSPWEEVLQLFPTTFGDLQHIAVVSTGMDNLIHIFFVGKTNVGAGDIYHLWHMRSSSNNDSFATPIDVLLASGGSPVGTPYDMPIQGAFCPGYGDSQRADVNKEIVLTFFIQATNSIIVQQVGRQVTTWTPARTPSMYSPWQVVPHVGIPAEFNILRSRVSLRPFGE